MCVRKTNLLFEVTFKIISDIFSDGLMRFNEYLEFGMCVCTYMHAHLD